MKHLFGMALVLCLAVSGAAFAQTIDDIQYYNPLDGSPLPGQDPLGWNADLTGQIVTVTGVLIEKHQYSSGSAYIFNDTYGGISIYHGATPMNGEIGDEIEITGTVGTFGGEIQLGGAITSTVLTSGNSPVPLEWTITQMMSTYENVGWFATAIGVVDSLGSGRFYMNDGTNRIQVYIDSTTGIDISAVGIGDTYQVTSPVVVYLGEMEMKPRFQSDLVENPGGDTLPVISSVDSDNWTPLASDPVTISASIVDDSAVASASLYYRDSDGTTPGAWNSVPMSDQGGDVWAGTIPGGHSSTQVDYYLEATDDGAQTVTLPGAAPGVFLTVAVGFTPIWECVYAHPDSASQAPAKNGEYVNIRGIVTAGTSQVGSPTQFIVQEPDVNPATGDRKFSAVLVYETTAAYEYFQGDEVAIGGRISEYFGLSEMLPHNGNAVYLLSFGNDLPAASKVTTRELADDSPANVDGDGIMGEAWESVWVQTFNATVLDTLGFGEYIISSTGARPDSLVVDPLVALSYVGTIGDVLTVNSYMDYSFSRRDIVPVADEYIVQTGLSAANDSPTIMSAGGFHSVAPNPFNPQTHIKFVVNRENLVQLNVYNIRGQKVRTIVQDRMPANEYDLVWDGTDDAGRHLASGTYFARLRIGAEVVQVRPMTLLK